MIETVVSVQLPIGETLRIKKNSLIPDDVTGDESRIALISGMYGDELGGQYICGEIIRRIKEDYASLTGIVDVYPAINPLGLEARTRAVPTTDIDYSTVFPGDLNGGLEEYTAAKLMEDLKGASCCIDIHSSNIFLQEVPQVRLNDDYTKEQLELARLMNTELVWIHPSATVNEGSMAYSLNQIGIPTLVTESGAAFRISMNLRADHRGNFRCDEGTWNLAGQRDRKKETPIVEEDEISYLNCESTESLLRRRS
jgi:predicted deacylase